MQWLFVAAMLGFVGWALWRGYEAYSFRKLLSALDGEITESGLRRVLDRLTTHSIPNAQQFWNQLREIETRVANTRGISPGLKAEFKTLIDAKTTRY